MSTTDPTAETLPNPYRFTVDIRHVGKWHQMWLMFTNNDRAWGVEEFFLAGFDTKEEADTHAALILSALHQAVME